MNNKNLQSLLEILAYKQCLGPTNISVNAITLDSRIVTPTTLFIAQKGETVDGHDFIDQAIEKGGKIIVCEILPKNTDQAVTYICVEDTHEVAGIIASWFYDFPSKELTAI